MSVSIVERLTHFPLNHLSGLFWHALVTCQTKNLQSVDYAFIWKEVDKRGWTTITDSRKNIQVFLDPYLKSYCRHSCQCWLNIFSFPHSSRRQFVRLDPSCGCDTSANDREALRTKLFQVSLRQEQGKWMRNIVYWCVILFHSNNNHIFNQLDAFGKGAKEVTSVLSGPALKWSPSPCAIIHCVLRHATSARPMRRRWPPTTTGVKVAARKLGQRAQSLIRRQDSWRPVNQNNNVTFNTASLFFIVGEYVFVQTYTRA